MFFLMFTGLAVAATTPTVTGVSAITADGSYNAGEVINISVTFSEEVMINAGTPVVHLETGTTDRDAVYASGATTTVFYFTYTVQAGDTASDLDYKAIGSLAGDIRGITIDHVVADNTLAAPGAAGSLGANKAIVIDTTAPTLEITLSDSALKAGDTATVTFGFSEAPAAGTFTSDDVTSPNGALSSFAVDGSNSSKYTATFTPTADIIAAENVITIGTSWTDAAGNAPAAETTSSNYAIDTVRPVVAITLSDYAFKVGDTATATFDFSKAPTSFTVDDVTAPNGALSDFAVDGSNSSKYTATFTPTATTTDAENVITVGTSWTDAAGNAPAAETTSSNYAIDTLRPTLEITLSDSALKAGDTATVTFGFSEAPTDFTVDDVTAPNGALSDFAVDGSNSSKYTATFTPTADFIDGTNSITVGTSWTDAAGNAPAAETTSSNYAIDTLRPTLEITLSGSALKAGDTATVTFDFSKAPADGTFTSDDVTSPNGALSDFAVDGSNSSKYTATFTPSTDTTASTNVVTVGTSWTDAAGNAPAAETTSSNYAIDTLAPTVALTYSAFPAKAGALTITATYSEAIAVTPTISIDQQGTTDITTQDMSGGATVWTYAYTVTAANGAEYIDGSATVSLSSVADAAGNNAGAPTNTTFVIDTLAPSVVITMNDTAFKIGDIALVTFDFSEAPTGFTVDDVTAPNGALNGFAVDGSNSSKYTAIFIPSTTTTASTNVVTVGTSWTDAAGNAPAAETTSSNYAIDTVRPVVAITLSDSALKIGDTATVTFDFSKAPADGTFTSDDVTSPNGALSDFAVDGSNSSKYTATFTPSTDTTASTNVVTVGTSWTDAAGNAPAAETTSSNYAIDTVRPTIISLSSDGKTYDAQTTYPLNITANFTESLSVAPTIIVGRASGNVTPSVGTCGDENASTWCFEIEEAGTNLNATRTVFISAAQDLATNTMVANSAHTFAVNTMDTLAPSVFKGGYSIDTTQKIVNVTIYGSEALNASTLMTTFDGANMTYAFGSGTTYKFTYNFTGKTDGTYDVTVSSCYDLSGNACVLEPVYFPMSIDITKYGRNLSLAEGWQTMTLAKQLLQNLSPANTNNYTVQNVLDVKGGIAGSYDYIQYCNTTFSGSGNCWLSYDPTAEVNSMTEFNDAGDPTYYIHMNVTDTLKLKYKSLA